VLSVSVYYQNKQRNQLAYTTLNLSSLSTRGPTRLAGIGGLSELLGWTKPQQENGQSAFFGGVNTVLAVVAVILVLDLVSIPLGKFVSF
jgi:hypothetical protein